jgi:hypothetical protein
LQIDQGNAEGKVEDESKVKDESKVEDEEDPFGDNEIFTKMNESGQLVCLNFSFFL